MFCDKNASVMYVVDYKQTGQWNAFRCLSQNYNHSAFLKIEKKENKFRKKWD